MKSHKNQTEYGTKTGKKLYYFNFSHVLMKKGHFRRVWGLALGDIGQCDYNNAFLCFNYLV